MGKHYNRIDIINLSEHEGWKGLGLYFARTVPPPTPEDDVEQIRRAYERAITKLHQCADGEYQFMPIFNQIKASVEACLVAEGGRASDGREAVAAIEASIVGVGRRKRGKYLLHLLCWSTASAIGGWLLWVILSKIGLPTSSEWLLAASLMIPGGALGVAFMGFFVNRSLVYENLGRLDTYDFSPWERLAWVSLVASVLLAALWNSVLILGSGSLILNEVTKYPSYGFIIGLVAGVAEATVSELLIARLKPVEKQAASQN